MMYRIGVDHRTQLESNLWDKMEALLNLRITCRKLAQQTADSFELEGLSASLYEWEELLRLSFRNMEDLLESVKLGHLDIIWENKEEYDNE